MSKLTETNPPVGEAGFIEMLEKKAIENRRLIATEMLPSWARKIGDWLVVNPWRVIVPGAGITYCVLRITLGAGLREFVLGLFGGFA